MLSDGAIGQMMEKVYLSPFVERSKTVPDWATTGKPATRQRNIITSLDLDPNRQELFNVKLLAKYDEIREKEVRFEEFQCDDLSIFLLHMVQVHGYARNLFSCQRTRY